MNHLVTKLSTCRGRGYFYAEYDTHRNAALARRRLVPGKVFLLGMEITRVDWAEPEIEVDEHIMAKVTFWLRVTYPSRCQIINADNFDNSLEYFEYFH